MKNLIKRISSFALILVMLFAFFQTNVLAYENDGVSDLSFDQYEQFQEEGILGSDVTYEDWVELVNSSKELEKSLENSTEFEEVYSSDRITPSSNFTMRRGDVVITNGTSSAGILGHSGIATSSNLILHIAGPGEHPKRVTLASWHSSYTNKTNSSWTKIYRHTSSIKASDAAKWVEDTYVGSGAEYKITGNLASISVTYCSKMVWQGYYYGPSTREANGPTIGYRMPYDLPSTVHNLTLQRTY